MNILHCQNTKGSNRLLVGTYAAYGNETAARTALNNIPQDSPGNIGFHQLYNAVLNQQNQTIEQVASNPTDENAAYAQSILAGSQSQHYNRFSAPAITESAKRNDIRVLGENELRFYPNPTENTLQFKWADELERVSFEIAIFDLKGQLLLIQMIENENTIIDVSSLSAGIYYCRVADFDFIEKLVIIK